MRNRFDDPYYNKALKYLGESQTPEHLAIKIARLLRKLDEVRTNKAAAEAQLNLLRKQLRHDSWQLQCLARTVQDLQFCINRKLK